MDPRLTGYCRTVCYVHVSSDSGLKTVYLQVKNIRVIYMYTIEGSWFHKRMALGKKEWRCAFTDDCGIMNFMSWPLKDLPGIRNGVVGMTQGRIYDFVIGTAIGEGSGDRLGQGPGWGPRGRSPRKLLHFNYNAFKF